MRRKFRCWGLSLVELIVSLGVMSVLLVSLAMVMNAGYEEYWTASGSMEVQKAVLNGTQLLIKDITRTNMGSVEISDPNPRPNPNVPVYDTMICASPEDMAGERHYSMGGNVLWQSYTGYYTTTSEGVTSLIRNRRAVATPSTTVPIPNALGVNIASLQSQLAAQVILRGVGSFDLVQKEDLIEVELMGIFEQRGVFTITLRNQGFPKN